MTCPLCNDTGDQRYWEGRWRDEKAENERLTAALRRIAIGTADEQYPFRGVPAEYLRNWAAAALGRQQKPAEKL